MLARRPFRSRILGGVPRRRLVAVACLGLAAVTSVGLAPAVRAQIVGNGATARAGGGAGAGASGGGYAGYGGTRWSTDYGIGSGRCDRDAIALSSGASAGEAPKTLVQRHEENLTNRTVGIIGATTGSGLLLSTRTLGGRLDDRDRHCLGHVLELGTVGREVTWVNPGTRQTHVAVVNEYTPTARIPSGTRPGANERCRVLIVTSTAVGVAARGPSQTLLACQANPGVWSIR